MSHLNQTQIHGFERRAKNLITQTGGFQHQDLRVKQTTLHNYTDPDMRTYQMPVDIAVELEIQRGKPLMTEYMASLQGYRVIPIEAKLEKSEFFNMTAKLGKEFGEFIEAIISALRDRKITKEEAINALSELDDVQELFNEFRVRLVPIAEGKMILKEDEEDD